MTITIAYADDWEGLYADDVLQSEEHSIDKYTILELWKRIGPIDDFAYLEIKGSWLQEEGYLPRSLAIVRKREEKTP